MPDRPSPYQDRGDRIRTEDDYGFFHVCTNGTVLPWLFKDEEDFILYGTRMECLRFINKYKLQTGKWIFHKYGISQYLKHLPISIIRLKTEEDFLETAVYIDRNAIMGGFPGMPYEYPWSSCRLMFRSSEDRHDKLNVISDFSGNELRDLLKSRISLPKDWTFDNKRQLNPLHFTDIKKTESIFKSPSRYLFYLVKKTGRENQSDIGARRKTICLRQGS